MLSMIYTLNVLRDLHIKSWKKIVPLNITIDSQRYNVKMLILSVFSEEVTTENKSCPCDSEDYIMTRNLQTF